MHAALIIASVVAVLVAAANGSPVREGQIPVSVVEVGVSELRDSPALQVAEKEPLLTKLDEAADPLPEHPVEAETLAQGPPKQVVGDLVPDSEAAASEAADTQLRQGVAVQSTTPGNFVAQLIQSSPIGQFINQLTGQNQNPPAGVAADQPATPSPGPAFPSPADAIQSAQHAVQNAAQSLMNTTNSALQGIQNYASSFTNQLQNTFSTLTGQQQQQQAAAAAGEATTTRRPGPFQSFVSNLVGNQASPTAAPAQPQGPLQGLISFLQGGNNNNNNNNNQPPKPVETTAQDPAKPTVDNKLENAQNDKPADEVFEETLNGDDADAAIATNEVRNSAEVVVEEDSFEEAQPNEELIVVNDASGSENN